MGLLLVKIVAPVLLWGRRNEQSLPKYVPPTLLFSTQLSRGEIDFDGVKVLELLTINKYVSGTRPQFTVAFH